MFIREELHEHITGYSCKILPGAEKLPVTILRFELHESAIAFVSGQIESLEEQECAPDTPFYEATKRHRFARLTEK